jgi:hypothetical protein
MTLFTEERLSRVRFNSKEGSVLASSWGELRQCLRCEATRNAQSTTDAATGVVAGCLPRVGYWKNASSGCFRAFARLHSGLKTWKAPK